MEDEFNGTQNPNDYCDYCHKRLGVFVNCYFCRTPMCEDCGAKVKCKGCGIYTCMDCCGLTDWNEHQGLHKKPPAKIIKVDYYN